MISREKLLANRDNAKRLHEQLALDFARNHMADFALYTDSRYRMNWHHTILCEYLDRFVAKEIRRLMVFMPPRHGKSELVRAVAE